MNINEALDNAPNNIIQISSLGAISPSDTDPHTRRFMPITIQRTQGYGITRDVSYRFCIRRDGDLLVAIELVNPSFEALIATSSTFGPMGYGTPEAWGTLMGWAADVLA